ncbi:MAG: NAD-dependent epimerase/dehydratase family protein [Flavitalea sp.]
MKVLVTGASGFIGRKLTFELAEKGYEVIALCRNPKHPWLVHHKNIIPCQGDILNVHSLKRAMKGCGKLYHTAALAKMWMPDPSAFHTVNVIGTRNVFEVAGNIGVSKMVYTSTCGVWGPSIKHPMNEEDPRTDGYAINYERTKYLAEIEAKKFANQGLHIVTVNPSRVFGEGPVTGSNTVGRMVSAYLKGKWRMIPGSGDQVVNYAYLDDVVRGHVEAMNLGIPGERYILGGEDISYKEFFDTLKKICGKKYTMIRVPQKLIEAYSYGQLIKTRITGLAPGFLPEFAERLKKDQKYSSLKATANLNYTITPFAKGLNKTVRYFQQ